MPNDNTQKRIFDISKFNRNLGSRKFTTYFISFANFLCIWRLVAGCGGLVVALFGANSIFSHRIEPIPQSQFDSFRTKAVMHNAIRAGDVASQKTKPWVDGLDIRKLHQILLKYVNLK